MNKKVLFQHLVGLFLIIVIAFTYAKVKAQKEIYPNPCFNHQTLGYAWVKTGGVWLTSITTGDWETDNWFYFLNQNTTIVVLQMKPQYYLVCYDIGKDRTPLYGWAYKEQIILQSEIK